MQQYIPPSRAVALAAMLTIARSLTAADHGGFWSMLQQDGDPLRWCGASPLYALVAAVRPSQGTLLHYEQWNIDPQSVVSCAALAFIR